MTKIERIELEHKIISDIFLPVLREGITDVYTPQRNNSKWIRSSTLVTQASTVGRKKYLVKESAKAKFPEIIVGNFVERNVVDNFINGKINYRVDGELDIIITDVGDVTRVSNLAGQISDLLITTKYTTLRNLGISKLEFDIIPTPGYSDDDNNYNEKQINVRFEARLVEWQGPQ
jgi:hypothetical protein